MPGPGGVVPQFHGLVVLLLGCTAASQVGYLYLWEVTAVVANSFNPVQKLAETVQSTMFANGQEVAIEASLYRCEGRLATTDEKCMLVWDRFKHAMACASRGHRNRFKEAYRFKDGTEQLYVRTAVRRDGARPQALTPAPAKVAEPSVADLLKVIADLTAQVAALQAPKPRRAAKPKASKPVPDSMDLETLDY
jgi:hypothetical protein